MPTVFFFFFLQNCFVIHSVTYNQQLLSIPCGGGHRAWDFTLAADSLDVVYIKQREVNLYRVPFVSYQVIYEVNSTPMYPIWFQFVCVSVSVNLP